VSQVLTITGDVDVKNTTFTMIADSLVSDHPKARSLVALRFTDSTKMWDRYVALVTQNDRRLDPTLVSYFTTAVYVRRDDDIAFEAGHYDMEFGDACKDFFAR
jgi:hypothetical protein